MVRQLLISLLVAATATAAAPAGAKESGLEGWPSTWREQSEKTYDTGGLQSVKIDNARGVATVRRGPPGRIRLTALKIIRSGDREATARFARGTQVIVAPDGGRLVIRVRYPQRQSIKVSFWEMCTGFETPKVEVRLDVEVPEGFSAELGSTSGNLVTEGVTGIQELRTTSGDVSVHDAGGPLRAQSTSGSITVAEVGLARLETVSGDIKAQQTRGVLHVGTTSGEISVMAAEDSLRLITVSGDIRVERAPRGVMARTTSGGITVQAARGRVRLESSSGDVRVGLEAPLSQADVSTVSGDVSAALIGPVGLSLEMRTTNGTLDLDVPLAVKTVSRRVVAGVIGDGKAQVRLKSSSGDIHLSNGDLR